MAHPALKRFSYFGQFGILAGFIGAGLVAAAVVSLLPFLFQPDLKDFVGSSSEDVMEKLLVPENADILRFVQFLSTFFLFFLPTFIYAKICHKKAGQHLGFAKSVSSSQMITVVALMLVSLPFANMWGQIVEMLPFSEATLKKFKLAEEEYARQISVIGRMDNFWDYLMSLFMLAILPAVFEETLFRGGIQNLLTRWFKMPVLAIIITSLIFSAVHFSYLGFITRVILSVILGWMYYRTGNLWLSVIGHVVNNAAGITVLYIMKLKDPDLKLDKADPEFPLWLGLISFVFLILFMIVLEKLSKHQVVDQGKELVMEDISNNPFIT